MPVERKKELKRRRNRKRKLKKLKIKLSEAKNIKEKERLTEKIQKIQPDFTPQK